MVLFPFFLSSLAATAATWECEGSTSYVIPSWDASDPPRAIDLIVRDANMTDMDWLMVLGASPYVVAADRRVTIDNVTVNTFALPLSLPAVYSPTLTGPEMDSAGQAIAGEAWNVFDITIRNSNVTRSELSFSSNSSTSFFLAYDGNFAMNVVVENSTIEDTLVLSFGTVSVTGSIDLSITRDDLSARHGFVINFRGAMIAGRDIVFNFTSPSSENADALLGDVEGTFLAAGTASTTWTGEAGVVDLNDGEDDLSLDRNIQSGVQIMSNISHVDMFVKHAAVGVMGQLPRVIVGQQSLDLICVPTSYSDLAGTSVRDFISLVGSAICDESIYDTLASESQIFEGLDVDGNADFWKEVYHNLTGAAPLPAAGVAAANDYLDQHDLENTYPGYSQEAIEALGVSVDEFFLLANNVSISGVILGEILYTNQSSNFWEALGNVAGGVMKPTEAALLLFQ